MSPTPTRTHSQYKYSLEHRSAIYEFPHLLPEDYHENEIEYEACPNIVDETLCVTQRFVFALDRQTRKSVLGWNVETGHLCQRVQSQDEIQDVSVSSDSTRIVMMNLHRELHVVNLEFYFKRFPCDYNAVALLCENRDEEEEEEHRKQGLIQKDEVELNGFNVISFESGQKEETESKVDETTVTKKIMGDLNSDTQFSFLENNTLIVRSKHEIHVHEVASMKLW